jgi:uncharacterized protein (TIGR03083 family)
MKSDGIWKHIHAERAQLAETLSGLSAEQWASPSWCRGWAVRDTVGHVVGAAEQTPANFYKGDARRRLQVPCLQRAGCQTSGRPQPRRAHSSAAGADIDDQSPACPVMAMLGEVVVHGEDIRRPLGLVHRSREAALVALADSWKKSNLLIGAKRRVAGLRLRATDANWVHGDGPEVTGPLSSLVLAMTGRKGAHDDLTGEGLAALANRP